MASAHIVDIRVEKGVPCLKEVLEDNLQPVMSPGGLIKMPSLVLWDEKGLQKFEDVTHTPQYYLTNEEIEILQKYGGEIAATIEPGSVLIELGSGNLRKVKILLDALEALGKNIDYYALDVSAPELIRTLMQMPTSTYKHVRCFGLLGTYDDARLYLMNHSGWCDRKKYVLSLGSTIGSFERDEAAQFVKSFTVLSDETSEVTASGDASMILGLDGCKDSNRVFQAYNDPQGNNHVFVKNGLAHANKVLGHEAFKEEDWDVQGEWDEKAGAHIQYYIATAETQVKEQEFDEGDRIMAVKSVKYDDGDREMLYDAADAEETAAWKSSGGDYGIYVVEAKARSAPTKVIAPMLNQTASARV